MFFQILDKTHLTTNILSQRKNYLFHIRFPVNAHAELTGFCFTDFYFPDPPFIGFHSISAAGDRGGRTSPVPCLRFAYIHVPIQQMVIYELKQLLCF